jgi:hypothetical protein
MNVTIPHGGEDFWDGIKNAPCWKQPVDSSGQKCKPLIRCNCGAVTGIGLHQVHADGRVTASYFHATKAQVPSTTQEDGCGWHVFLTLAEYNGGEFLSESAPKPS